VCGGAPAVMLEGAAGAPAVMLEGAAGCVFSSIVTLL